MKVPLSLLMMTILLTGPGGAASPAGASASMVPVRPELAAQLADAPTDEALLVLVTGETTSDAVAAVEAVGLTTVEVFDRLSVVAALGPPEAIRTVHAEPGVRRVDANAALEWMDDVAHRATGVAQLRDSDTYPQLRSERRRDKTPYDGTGVSIAVIDSGFDTTHEQFVEGGETKFDVHLRQACPLPREDIHYTAGMDPGPDCSLWLPGPPSDDASSGHGTSVAGVAAGYPRATSSGAGVSGVAPGARLAGLSIGATVQAFNAISALNWVLEHHEDPCGDGSCPPIRVVNNSYGAPADDDLASRSFDPESPFSRVTTELVEAGVVVVFAAGNSGGDGSTNNSSFWGLNPVPGYLTVGAYGDGDSGDRNGGVADFSSRGLKGDPSTYPDLVAPGERLLFGCSPGSVICTLAVSDGDSHYGARSGTSYASPYAAGVVAQLFEADPSLTPAEVEDILEDSSYQGFITGDLLEADTYVDTSGVARSNDDHLTSFHAGHGLVDAVGALSAVGKGKIRRAPDPCPARSDEVTIADRRGDAALFSRVPSPVARSGFDIVEVTATLLENPGALTVTVTLDDLPEADPHMHLTVTARIDGNYLEVDLDRSLDGDTFSVFRGRVEVDGSVDPDADTVTFVIRPQGGAVQERAGLGWTWASNTKAEDVVYVDFTEGACSIWVPNP